MEGGDAVGVGDHDGLRPAVGVQDRLSVSVAVWLTDQ